MKDIKGIRYGRLTAQDVVGKDGNRVNVWQCRCDCGNITNVAVSSLNRRKNPTQSCGCLQREIAMKMGSVCGKMNETHGFSRTPEYRSFIAARHRCAENGEYYKRIKFLFKSFEDFLLEIGLRPSRKYSLERIDNNGDYEKGNVCWATKVQQMRNRRAFKAIENFSDLELMREMRRRNLSEGRV